MWDGIPGYSTLMGFGFLSNLLVCVFWLGHLGHLHLMLILLCVNLILPFCYWLFFPFVSAVSSLHHWSLPFGSFLQWLLLDFFSVFSAFFRSSCRAGLVVMKSLNHWLSVKDFISVLLMKFSLAGYEILGWKFFSLKMLNIGPHSLLACRVSAERSAVSLMCFPLVGDLNFLSGCP